MKKIEIYEMLIKITGIFFILTSIDQLNYGYSYIVMYIANQVDILTMSISVFTFITTLLLIFFLIFRSDKIAKLICKKNDLDEGVNINIEKNSLIELALIITGLITIIFNLDNLFRIINDHTHKHLYTKESIDVQIKMYFFKLLIALIFVVFHSKIANLFSKKRTIK